MKRFLLIISLLAVAASLMTAGPIRQRYPNAPMVSVYNRITHKTNTYPVLTLRQISEVPMDSLIKAQQIQSTTGRDTAMLQISPYFFDSVVTHCVPVPDSLPGHDSCYQVQTLDTVVIRSTVVAPYNVINYFNSGYVLILQDTINAYPWGGGFAYAINQTQSILDGFQNPERGDLIEMTVVIDVFPRWSLNSYEELGAVPGDPIKILHPKAVQPPVHKEISDFYHGVFEDGSGKVQFTTGEPYELLVVEFTNLDYVSPLTTGTGRNVFLFQDTLGNQLTTYDASRWFTTRPDLDANTGNPYRDPLSTWAIPKVGTHIDTIRGYLEPVSGRENPRGYRLAPIFQGDVVFGKVKPTMDLHRRNPVLVTAADSGKISAQVSVGTYPVTGTDSVVLFYSVNFGAYQKLQMTLNPGDTVYKANIPPQALGSFVQYFMKVRDSTGLNTLYANAHPTLGRDTSKGRFFYKVLSGQPTLSDVQYTPFKNGYSPYVGAKVTISGTVTADTNHLGKTMTNPLAGFGTYVYYIQTGNAPWNGLWVQAPESLMHGIINGDSILVRGTVGEGTRTDAIVTQLYAIDSVFVIAHNRPVPAPVVKTITVFSDTSANGTPTAEPYEGMLVRFLNVSVNALSPYFSDPTEYSVTDGSGGDIYVRRDGVNNYSNQIADTALGKLILHVGDKIDTLTGVMFFSNNRWKIVPRANDDFASNKYYQLANRWNIISVPQRVLDYKKSVIYPNPVSASPAYAYVPGLGYQQRDTLKNGVGYWLKIAGSQTIRYNGLNLLVDTIPVTAGWNMIGSISDSVTVGSIVQIPASNISGPIYQYNNGYSSVTSIKGGRGYWVKVNHDGHIVLGSGTFFNKEPDNDGLILQALNSVTITDRDGKSQTMYFGPVKDGKLDASRYEMPPLPPSGEFDARFVSQRLAELYPNQLKSPLNYPIKLTSAAYPITVTWSIADKDPNKSFLISSNSGEKNAKALHMIGTGSAIIKSAKDNMIFLTIDNSNLPRQFALSQNYPNPFNPTTRFTMSVPQTARIEVVVYDILGRKVKTLLNEDKAPGYYTIEWSGLSEFNTSVASGVYFVRMNSERFTTVRKIMMMK